MAVNEAQNLTQMLSLACQGNESAAAHLLPAVYEELRQLARRYFRRDGGASTLQPTALVHEAFMKLIDSDGASWKDRAHFFAIAATAMRQVVIDHARAKQTDKRGGDWQRISFTHAQSISAPGDEVNAIALNDALDRLAAKDKRKAQVVEMRVFSGLTCDEIGQLLNVSHRTVENDWYSARAWLERELDDRNEQGE